jgi:hypothetical protein
VLVQWQCLPFQGVQGVGWAAPWEECRWWRRWAPCSARSTVVSTREASCVSWSAGVVDM